MDDASLQEELEVLQSIYLDDLIIHESDSCTTLQMTLHPSTADKADMKYVCVTLHITLTEHYPKKEPQISIKNPRGLSDAHIVSIEENLLALSMSKVGESMIYELFEYAKESLTDNNHPSCLCPICLEAFKESDKFFRTDCYHYYHLICIKGYIDVSPEKKCPVCRTNFDIDETIFQGISLPQEDSNSIKFLPDEQYYKWRRNCEKLFEKQKTQGGIIDLEFERNKYLITLNSTEAVPTTPIATPIATPITTSTTTHNCPASGVQSKPQNQDVEHSSSRNYHPPKKHSQGHSTRKKTSTHDYKARFKARPTEQQENNDQKSLRRDNRMKPCKSSKGMVDNETSEYKQREESEVKHKKVPSKKNHSLRNANKNERTGGCDTDAARNPYYATTREFGVSECRKDHPNSLSFQRDVSVKPRPPPGFHLS